jgi:hypothetical protein
VRSRFVSPSARERPDRGGDPLDGLVNLFDLGIVLSVGFLLAALASLHLNIANRSQLRKATQVVVKPGQRAQPLGQTHGRVIGHGHAVGRVYRLSDGRLVYVKDPGK